MFTRDNILHALRVLGIVSEGQKKEWITVSCINPAHKDDTPSAGFHIQNGAYYCFGCSYTTNLIKLIQEFTGLNHFQAEEFIKNNGALTTPHINISVKKNEENYFQEEEEYKKEKIITIETLKFNPDDYLYTSSRGFTVEICKLFDIEKCISSNYMDYFIIPIKDKKKGINTFEARKLMQYEYLKKYYNSSSDFKQLDILYKEEKKKRGLKLKGYTLYENNVEIFDLLLQYLLQTKVLYPSGANVNQTIFNIDCLDFSKPLYLVEGMGSIPKIYSEVSKNVSCTFGSNVSEDQLEYLSKFPKIIIIPDNDLAGFKMVATIADKIKDTFVIPVEADDTDPVYVKNLITTPEIFAQRYIATNRVTG